jgi:hypothetical protein
MLSIGISVGENRRRKDLPSAEITALLKENSHREMINGRNNTNKEETKSMGRPRMRSFFFNKRYPCVPFPFLLSHRCSTSKNNYIASSLIISHNLSYLVMAANHDTIVECVDLFDANRFRWVGCRDFSKPRSVFQIDPSNQLISSHHLYMYPLQGLD